MRRTGVVMLMIVISMTLVGFAWSFKVKNTDGLRAAYKKIERAYSMVSEIEANKHLKTKDRQALIDSYNEAKASVNSFLKDVKTKSINSVDVPKDKFDSDEANQKIDKFISDAKASMKGAKAIPAAIVVAIAVPIIEKVWELNKKDQKEAYERFAKIIDDNMMVEFEELSKKLKQ